MLQHHIATHVLFLHANVGNSEIYAFTPAVYATRSLSQPRSVLLVLRQWERAGAHLSSPFLREAVLDVVDGGGPLGGAAGFVRVVVAQQRGARGSTLPGLTPRDQRREVDARQCRGQGVRLAAVWQLAVWQLAVWQLAVWQLAVWQLACTYVFCRRCYGLHRQPHRCHAAPRLECSMKFVRIHVICAESMRSALNP